MINVHLIEQAMQLAINYFEINGYAVDNKIIKRRILDWYNNSDITDAEMLAAAAIESDYQCDIDYNTIVRWKEYYF